MPPLDPGRILQDEKTGKFEVVRPDRSLQPFDSLAQARAFRDEQFVQPILGPRQPREFGQTFMEELTGGLQQIVSPLTEGANVGMSPLGALRTAGAPLAELGVQAQRGVQAAGVQIGLPEQISLRAGQTVNLLAQLLPTDPTGITRGMRAAARNLRPFFQSLVTRAGKQEAKGGFFRPAAQQAIRGLQREIPPQTIEGAIDFVQQSGIRFIQAERTLSRQVGDAIDASMRAIPTTAVRPATATREATNEALEILGAKAREGIFPGRPERVTKTAKRFVTPKRPPPSPILTPEGLPFDLPPEALEALQSGRPLSVQAMDELRKIIGNAIGQASRQDNRRAVLALGRVLDGIKRDITKFADEFPEQVASLKGAHELFRTRVVPLRGLSGLEPSQVVPRLLRKTPEEIRQVVKALPPSEKGRIGDGIIEELLGRAIDPVSGFFEPSRFLRSVNTQTISRVRELIPDRFNALMSLRSTLQRVVPKLEELQRKGGVTRAFGLAQMVRGVFSLNVGQIKRGASAALAPIIFQKLAQTRAGLQLIGRVADETAKGVSLAEIARKTVSLTNAALRELEREGIAIEDLVQPGAEAAPSLGG